MIQVVHHATSAYLSRGDRFSEFYSGLDAIFVSLTSNQVSLEKNLVCSTVLLAHS